MSSFSITKVCLNEFNSWISRHVKDEFVKFSRTNGYRARSAYKLLQIIEKFPQINSSIREQNSKIIDLGAAPGSWAQVLSQFSDSSSKIVALDLVPIKPLENVQFINLDFTKSSSFKILREAFDLKSDIPFVNLVVSDLCVNLSGNSCVDNAKNFELWKRVLEFSNYILKSKGHLILKYFESEEAKRLRIEFENKFESVIVFKPKASRSESAEKYFICLNNRN